jgi:dipeptidase D
MQGGFKDNVIPREANAQLFLSGGDNKDLKDEFNNIKNKITELMAIYQQELSASEPELTIQVEDMGDDTYEPLHPVSFEKMLFLLLNMPNGVQVMSSHIKGLVESSLNLGIFHMEENLVTLCFAVRSSVSSYKHYISNRLSYISNFLGGDYFVRNEYPSWEFKTDSPLREHFKKLYQELCGKDMKVEAIHAGLECGLIHEKIPGIDIVSVGPDMFGVHTIEEKLSISSTIRVYKFLETVMKEKIRA